MRPRKQQPYCPVCALGSQAKRLVGHELNRGTKPFGVLTTLQELGLQPLDLTGLELRTPGKWSAALELHLTGCLGRKWEQYQARVRDATLQAELKSRLASAGQNTLDTELKVLLERSRHPQLPTADQVRAEIQAHLSGVLVKQLQVLEKEQDRYLSGRSANPPLELFEDLGAVVDQAKELGLL